VGYSVLKFRDNSRFLFDNNQAQDGGGAIFQLALSTRDVQISRTLPSFSKTTQELQVEDSAPSCLDLDIPY